MPAVLPSFTTLAGFRDPLHRSTIDLRRVAIIIRRGIENRDAGRSSAATALRQRQCSATIEFYSPEDPQRVEYNRDESFKK